MTRKEIINYCLTFPAAFKDYPFTKISSKDKGL